MEPPLCSPSFSVSFTLLIAIITLISRALFFLLYAILLALILIDRLHHPKGQTQYLIQPNHSSGDCPMKPCRKDESSNDIADVVDLRDQEHVHHEDKTEKGRTCHPIQLEEDQFEEDGSQGASVS